MMSQPADNLLRKALHAAGAVELPPDEAAARQWLMQAVDGGNSPAAIYLGYSYLDGQHGLTVDPSAAMECFRRALALGDGDAWEGLTRAQNALEMAEADAFYRAGQPDAVALYKAAAAKGNARAAALLGAIYRDGKCGEKANASRALGWFEEARNLGSPQAASGIGELYAQGGEDLPADGAKAIQWYRTAALEGDNRALWMLGFIHYYGIAGVPESTAEGMRWFAQAKDKDAIPQEWLQYAQDGDEDARRILEEIEIFQRRT